MFAASVRYFELDPAPMVKLLQAMPHSHLLLWTGSGEMAIRESTVRAARALFKSLGLLDRVGFDVLLATSCMQVGQAKTVDCTFVSSRWVRWLFGCHSGLAARAAAQLHANPRASSEAEALLARSPSIVRTPSKDGPPLPRQLDRAEAQTPATPVSPEAAELPRQTHELK